MGDLRVDFGYKHAISNVDIAAGIQRNRCRGTHAVEIRGENQRSPDWIDLGQEADLVLLRALHYAGSDWKFAALVAPAT